MFARPCVQACSSALLVRIHADVSPRTRHACQVQSCKDSREATCSTITLHTSLFHMGGEWLRSARRARSLAAPGLGSSLKAQPNTLPHLLLSQGIAPILTLTYGANSGPKDPKIMADWICNWNLLHSGKIGVVLHLHNCENKTYLFPNVESRARMFTEHKEAMQNPQKVAWRLQRPRTESATCVSPRQPHHQNQVIRTVFLRRPAHLGANPKCKRMQC